MSRPKIALSEGVYVYADAVPPFRVEAFKSGFACVLDALGRNLCHTAGGGTLFTPGGAKAVAELATKAIRAAANTEEISTEASNV